MGAIVLRLFFSLRLHSAPTHGQLDKYHILFADPQRPVHYLGQGKIQRYRTTLLYEKDIEELYDTAEDAEAVAALYDLSELNWIDFSNRDSIKMRLRELFVQTSGIENLKVGDNFFQIGIDSLQVLRIARQLNIQAKLANIKSPGGSRLIATIIYANPTLNQLTGALFDMTRTIRLMDDKKEVEDQRIGKMQSLLDKHVALLPMAKRPRSPPQTDGWVVLLTGSTGSLGSYILNELQADNNIKSIICLDRSADAAERHRQTGPKRGLDSIDPSRVTFLKAELANPQLGLTTEMYESLRNSVTHIIHNQWPVNFNWPLALFEPSIAGVRNLASLAATSTQDAFLLFVSSVSSVGGSKGEGPFPETPVTDFSMAAHSA
ncbi:hypothetical protein ONZ43_g5062 [Nemania bipapillata]|uniref:Uncharacterized protein n=1 Tax=Nemania bipapillata TaxID=110536 RepID=A0ACC2IF84_9PEZI|nr:hypothetical protein ONZ43_g5062 [Nemania bipapillata]